MQKEKLAVIGLVVIIIVALSAFIAITYGQDIIKNLFGGEEQVLAKDDTIVCYKNKDNKINYIISNDKYTNISSFETQIQIISQPANGIISIKNDSIVYSPNLDFLGTDSFIYKIIDQDGKTSQANVKIQVEIPKIEIGDCADVYYVGMFSNGTVFDTNIEEVARANGIYNETNPYTISNVFVDPTLELYPPVDYEENYTSEYIKGFLDGLIGMGEGEKRNVTIPPEDAYGTWNESLAEEFMMDSIPLDNIIENNVTENITDFSSYYPDVNVAKGITFDYGFIAFGQANVMSANILEVTDENLTYQLFVENGTTIKLPLFNWNVTFIVENDTAFNMHSEIEVNHTFTYGDYWGAIHFKVVAVNETAAKLAVNMEAPTIDFVDQTLIFELEVVNIYKTSTELES
jgi:FKBP-type peptidyl-prolyl cis-trans isomerase 2